MERTLPSFADGSEFREEEPSILRCSNKLPGDCRLYGVYEITQILFSAKRGLATESPLSASHDGV